jgi:hypothetical protein
MHIRFPAHMWMSVVQWRASPQRVQPRKWLTCEPSLSVGSVRWSHGKKTGMCWEAREQMRADVLLNRRSWDCCCMDRVIPKDPFYLCITQVLSIVTTVCNIIALVPSIVVSLKDRALWSQFRPLLIISTKNIFHFVLCLNVISFHTPHLYSGWAPGQRGVPNQGQAFSCGPVFKPPSLLMTNVNLLIMIFRSSCFILWAKTTICTDMLSQILKQFGKQTEQFLGIKQQEVSNTKTWNDKDSFAQESSNKLHILFKSNVSVYKL